METAFSTMASSEARSMYFQETDSDSSRENRMNKVESTASDDSSIEDVTTEPAQISPSNYARFWSDIVTEEKIINGNSVEPNSLNDSLHFNGESVSVEKDDATVGSSSGDDSASLQSLASDEDEVAHQNQESQNESDEKSQSDGSESSFEGSVVSADSSESVGHKRKQNSNSLHNFGNHALLQYHFSNLPTSNTATRKSKSTSRQTKRSRVRDSTTLVQPQRQSHMHERTSDEQDAYILQSAERWLSKGKQQRQFNWNYVAKKLGLGGSEVRTRYEKLVSTSSNVATHSTPSSTSSSTTTVADTTRHRHSMTAHTTTTTTQPTSTLHTTAEQDAYLLHTVDTAVRKKTGVYWSVVAQRLNCTVAEAKAHWQKLTGVQNNGRGGSSNSGSGGSSSSGGGGDIAAGANSGGKNGSSIQGTIGTVSTARTDSTKRIERIANTTSETNAHRTTNTTDNIVTLQIHKYILQCVHAQSYLLYPPTNNTNNNDTADTTSSTTTVHSLDVLWRQLSVELGVTVASLVNYWDKVLCNMYQGMHGGKAPATPLPHPGAGLSHAQTTQLCREVYAWAGQGQGLWARLALLLHTPSAELRAAWTRITPQEVQHRWADRACNMAAERYHHRSRSGASDANIITVPNSNTNITSSANTTTNTALATTVRTMNNTTNTTRKRERNPPITLTLSPHHIATLRRHICTFNLKPIFIKNSAFQFWRRCAELLKCDAHALRTAWRKLCILHGDSVVYPVLCDDVTLRNFTTSQDVVLIEQVRRYISKWGKVYWSLIAHDMYTNELLLVNRWVRCIRYNTMKLYKHVRCSARSGDAVIDCVNALVCSVELFHAADTHVHTTNATTNTSAISIDSAPVIDLTTNTTNTTTITPLNSTTVEYTVAGLLVDIANTVVIRNSVRLPTNTLNTNTNTTNTCGILTIPALIRKSTTYTDTNMCMLVQSIIQYNAGMSVYPTPNHLFHSSAVKWGNASYKDELIKVWSMLMKANPNSVYITGVLRRPRSPAYVVHVLTPDVQLVDSEQHRDVYNRDCVRKIVAHEPFIKPLWCRGLLNRPGVVYKHVRIQSQYVADTTNNNRANDVSMCINDVLTAVELTLQVDTALNISTTTPSTLRRRQDNEMRCTVENIVRGIVCAIVHTTYPALQTTALPPRAQPLQPPHHTHPTLPPLPSLPSLSYTPPSNPLYTLPPTIQSIWSSSVHTSTLPQRWQFSHDAAVMLALMQAQISRNNSVNSNSNSTNSATSKASSIDWAALAAAQGCSVEVVRQRGAQLVELFDRESLQVDNWYRQTVGNSVSISSSGTHVRSSNGSDCMHYNVDYAQNGTDRGYTWGSGGADSNGVYTSNQIVHATRNSNRNYHNVNYNSDYNANNAINNTINNTTNTTTTHPILPPSCYTHATFWYLDGTIMLALLQSHSVVFAGERVKSIAATYKHTLLEIAARADVLKQMYQLHTGVVIAWYREYCNGSGGGGGGGGGGGSNSVNTVDNTVGNSSMKVYGSNSDVYHTGNGNTSRKSSGNIQPLPPLTPLTPLQYPLLQHIPLSTQLPPPIPLPQNKPATLPQPIPPSPPHNTYATLPQPIPLPQNIPAILPQPIPLPLPTPVIASTIHQTTNNAYNTNSTLHAFLLSLPPLPSLCYTNGDLTQLCIDPALAYHILHYRKGMGMTVPNIVAFAAELGIDRDTALQRAKHMSALCTRYSDVLSGWLDAVYRGRRLSNVDTNSGGRSMNASGHGDVTYSGVHNVASSATPVIPTPALLPLQLLPPLPSVCYTNTTPSPIDSLVVYRIMQVHTRKIVPAMRALAAALHCTYDALRQRIGVLMRVLKQYKSEVIVWFNSIEEGVYNGENVPNTKESVVQRVVDIVDLTTDVTDGDVGHTVEDETQLHNHNATIHITPPTPTTIITTDAPASDTSSDVPTNNTTATNSIHMTTVPRNARKKRKLPPRKDLKRYNRYESSDDSSVERIVASNSSSVGVNNGDSDSDSHCSVHSVRSNRSSIHSVRSRSDEGSVHSSSGNRTHTNGNGAESDGISSDSDSDSVGSVSVDSSDGGYSSAGEITHAPDSGEGGSDRIVRGAISTIRGGSASGSASANADSDTTHVIAIDSEHNTGVDTIASTDTTHHTPSDPAPRHRVIFGRSALSSVVWSTDAVVSGVYEDVEQDDCGEDHSGYVSSGDDEVVAEPMDAVPSIATPAATANGLHCTYALYPSTTPEVDTRDSTIASVTAIEGGSEDGDGDSNSTDAMSEDAGASVLQTAPITCTTRPGLPHACYANTNLQRDPMDGVLMYCMLQAGHGEYCVLGLHALAACINSTCVAYEVYAARALQLCSMYDTHTAVVNEWYRAAVQGYSLESDVPESTIGVPYTTIGVVVDGNSSAESEMQVECSDATVQPDNTTESGDTNHAITLPPLPPDVYNGVPPTTIDSTIMHAIVCSAIGLSVSDDHALSLLLHCSVPTIAARRVLLTELFRTNKYTVHKWFYHVLSSQHADDTIEPSVSLLWAKSSPACLSSDGSHIVFSFSHDAKIMSALIHSAEEWSQPHVESKASFMHNLRKKNLLHRVPLLEELLHAERSRVLVWFRYTHPDETVAGDVASSGTGSGGGGDGGDGGDGGSGGSGGSGRSGGSSVYSHITPLPETVTSAIHPHSGPHDHIIMYTIIHNKWGLSKADNTALAGILGLPLQTIILRRAKLAVVFLTSLHKYVLHTWFHELWTKHCPVDSTAAPTLELLWSLSRPFAMGFHFAHDAAWLCKMIVSGSRAERYDYQLLQHKAQKMRKILPETVKRATDLVNLFNIERDKVMNWYNYTHTKKPIHGELTLTVPELLLPPQTTPSLLLKVHVAPPVAPTATTNCANKRKHGDYDSTNSSGSDSDSLYNNNNGAEVGHSGVSSTAGTDQGIDTGTSITKRQRTITNTNCISNSRSTLHSTNIPSINSGDRDMVVIDLTGDD